MCVIVGGNDPVACERRGDQIRKRWVSDQGGGSGKDPEGKCSWAVLLVEPSKHRLQGGGPEWISEATSRPSLLSKKLRTVERSGPPYQVPLRLCDEKGGEEADDGTKKTSSKPVFPSADLRCIPLFSFRMKKITQHLLGIRCHFKETTKQGFESE